MESTADLLLRLIEAGDSGLELGTRVILKRNGVVGTVRHVGAVRFNVGDYVGIELDEPVGNIDGTVEGIIYFSCKPKHGIFVTPLDIEVLAAPNSLDTQNAHQAAFEGLPPPGRYRWPVMSSRFPTKAPPAPPPGVRPKSASSTASRAHGTKAHQPTKPHPRAPISDHVHDFAVTPDLKLTTSVKPFTAEVQNSRNNNGSLIERLERPTPIQTDTGHDAADVETTIARRFAEWILHSHAPGADGVTASRKLSPKSGRNAAAKPSQRAMPVAPSSRIDTTPASSSYNAKYVAPEESVAGRSVISRGTAITKERGRSSVNTPLPKPKSAAKSSAFVRARSKLPASHVPRLSPQLAKAHPGDLVNIGQSTIDSIENPLKSVKTSQNLRDAKPNSALSAGKRPRAQSAPRSSARGVGTLAKVPGAKNARLRPVEEGNESLKQQAMSSLALEVASEAPHKDVGAASRRMEDEDVHHADEDVISSLIRARVMKTMVKPVKAKEEEEFRQLAQHRILRAAVTLTDGPVSPIDDHKLPTTRPMPDLYLAHEHHEHRLTPGKTMSISEFLARRRDKLSGLSSETPQAPPADERNAIEFVEQAKAKYAGASLLSVLVAKAKGYADASDATKSLSDAATFSIPTAESPKAVLSPSSHAKETLPVPVEEAQPRTVAVSTIPARRPPPPPTAPVAVVAPSPAPVDNTSRGQHAPFTASVGVMQGETLAVPAVEAVIASGTDAAPANAAEVILQQNRVNTQEQSDVHSAPADSGVDLVASTEPVETPDKVTANVHPSTVQENTSEGDNHAIVAADDTVKPVESMQLIAYAGLCEQGYSASQPDKPNQDSIIMTENPELDIVMLAVFDGHGEHGHFISQRFRDRLPELFFASPLVSEYIDVADNIQPAGAPLPASAPKTSLLPPCGPAIKRRNVAAAIKKALQQCEKEVLGDSSIDSTLSGCTGCILISNGPDITVANVGDSRCILIRSEYAGDELEFRAVPMSIDHKPTLNSEFKRILLKGGRVQAIKYDDGGEGPVRVWLKDDDIPGLAMSRSLCDTIGKKAGVISEPDFYYYRLTPSDKFIVLASDGLWEFTKLSETAQLLRDTKLAATEAEAAYAAAIQDSVAEVQEPVPHLQMALEQLAALAAERWQQREGVIDDTSIIIAELTPAPQSGEESKIA